MSMIRTNITVPAELLREVDEYAGPRGRSAYVTEAIERRLKRDRLARALDETFGATAGTSSWRSPEEVVAWANEIRESDRDRWEEVSNRTSQTGIARDER